MQLSLLTEGLGTLYGDGDAEITEVAYDSREVTEGCLFFCIDGTRMDGHDFAPQAVDKGARALVVTRRLPLDVPQLLVEDSRRAMALISARFFRHPAREMIMIGITGTKGKSSTAYLLEGVGQAAGHKTGLMGTIENRVGRKHYASKLTTPNSMDLQRMLRQMADDGVSWVVMEVASHGLTYQRVLGIQYDVAVFTNLSRDHLDDYGTMENYFAAKKLLFTSPYCLRAAVNADDPAGAEAADPTQVPILTYGIENGDLRAQDVDLSRMGGVDFTCVDGQERVPVHLDIPGRFNVYNAMAALAAAKCVGVPLETAARGMRHVQVPGRCELIGRRRGALILRDYAHSPDSLEKVLDMVNEFARGKTICVVGCGGNRDSGKRPIMGRIAGEKAAMTYITSDNPRFEDPEAILDMVEEGVRAAGNPYRRIENRREAIRAAIEGAGEGDIVLIAGKGHEDYQEIRGVKHPFDEKTVVAELLKELGE